MKQLTCKDLQMVQLIPNYYNFYLKGVCCFCIDNYKPKLYYNNDNRGIMSAWSLCENCYKKNSERSKALGLPLTEFSIKELFTIKTL